MGFAGKIIVIVVSVVSSVAVFTVALMITLYIWKHRYVQKKRKGSNDAKKPATILKDSSLNFKYLTLEKATEKWDDYNKLGKGGFGTVYKALIRGDKWAVAVENAIGKLLNAFIVTNHEDIHILRSCAREVNYHYLLIIIHDFARPRLQIPDHMLPQTNHPTVLSAIQSDSPMVVNVLVDSQDTVHEIVDPNLMMHKNQQKEAIKVVHVRLLCSQGDPSLRPSMSMVLKMLAKDDEPLPTPSNPPFIDKKTMELNEITQKLHYFCI